MEDASFQSEQKTRKGASLKIKTQGPYADEQHIKLSLVFILQLKAIMSARVSQCEKSNKIMAC